MPALSPWPAPLRGTCQAPWASTSSRSCGRLWTAGGPPSAPTTGTTAGRWRATSCSRLSPPWVTNHVTPSADDTPRDCCKSVVFCLAGYNLSPQAMNVVMKRYSTGGRIAFDDFISACIKLRALTGKWKASVVGTFTCTPKIPSLANLCSDQIIQVTCFIR